MRIKRAFTRKINLSKYGGNQYEMAEFYCEREFDVQPGGEVKELSKKLHDECKKDVEDSIDEYIKTIRAKKEEKENVDLNEEFNKMGRK